MSEDLVLAELREMERRLSAKISANNTQTAVVGQQVADHIEWEMKKYQDLGNEVKCIREKVGNLLVEGAVTKTKVGGIAAIVAAVLTGAIEAFRRMVG